ncbi:MAG: hypothetical protein JHD28_01330 [Bacteroidia bacterium]|nr:hypothetical protein [Bacteroidia bacterium]
MVDCSQEKSCDNLLITAFLVLSKGNIRIRSNLASECIDKPLADFVVVNLKMAGRLLNLCWRKRPLVLKRASVRLKILNTSGRLKINSTSGRLCKLRIKKYIEIM